MADVRPVNSVKIQPEQMHEVPEEEIDFEKIEREMGKLMIHIMRDRSKHYFEMSEACGKQWMAKVKENAHQYSWKKWNVSLPSAVILGLSGLQGGITAANATNLEAAKTTLEVIGSAQKAAEVGKQFFDTVSTGTRAEGQAKSDISKLLFERNEREAQSSEQLKAEAFRKAEEARRKREDIEQAMAR